MANCNSPGLSQPPISPIIFPPSPEPHPLTKPITHPILSKTPKLQLIILNPTIPGISRTADLHEMGASSYPTPTVFPVPPIGPSPSVIAARIPAQSPVAPRGSDTIHQVPLRASVLRQLAHISLLGRISLNMLISLPVDHFPRKAITS